MSKETLHTDLPPAKKPKLDIKPPETQNMMQVNFSESTNDTDGDKFSNFVTPEELEKLNEFKVLDEIKSNDEDSNDENSDSSDGKSEGLPEEEIEKMLEEDLPEGFKGVPKPKEKPYITRQKVVLEEKGVNHFEVLPLDWMMVRHYSGMPVYMHRTTRVCTLAKPYFLGKGNTRRHDIPISAIPCLAYRRALKEEEKQKEIDIKIQEQIKNGTWVNNVKPTDQNEQPAANNVKNTESCDKNSAEAVISTYSINTNNINESDDKNTDKFNDLDNMNNLKPDITNDVILNIELANNDSKHTKNSAEILDNKMITKKSKSLIDSNDLTKELETKNAHPSKCPFKQGQMNLIEKSIIKDFDIENMSVDQGDIEKPENENMVLHQDDIKEPETENMTVNKGDIKIPDTESVIVSQDDIEKPDTENMTVNQDDVTKPNAENMTVNQGDIRNPDTDNITVNVDIEKPNSECTDENKKCDTSTEEIPLNRQPVVLPGGIVMPPPRVETVNTSWKTQHLTPDQVNDYCKKLFKFKTVNIMHFMRWADRRKYTKARKTLQYPTLPEGTKLITIPAQTISGQDNGAGAGGKASKRDWVMNMTGRSYLSVFHEYVRRALHQQPVYEFKQLENASSPYQATVYIGGMQYGVGHGSSKRQAKSAAARASIHILIPEMRDEIDAHAQPPTADAEPDFTFFDYVGIEDPRITEFCAATCEPSPHAILRTCLLRNFGAGDRHIHTEMRKLEYQKIELTMKVGKHSATVVCKNKKTAKQRASQSILQALHPHVRSWGSLLRLYGSRSVPSCKERKAEEQQITLLQEQARHNAPNLAVLRKLRHEMRRLRARDAALAPLGTLLLPAPPSISASSLNRVEL